MWLVEFALVGVILYLIYRTRKRELREARRRAILARLYREVHGTGE